MIIITIEMKKEIKCSNGSNNNDGNNNINNKTGM